LTYQLRTYKIRPGELHRWVSEWRAQIRPLRERHGFKVVAAGVDETNGEFVWLIAHHGPGTFQEDDAAYYASPERRALDPDPARLILEARQAVLRPVV